MTTDVPYDPYLAVRLWDPETERAQYKPVHLLVLVAFKGRRPGTRYQVHGSHLDGNHLNNRLTNLDWESIAVNMERKVEHGTAKLDRAAVLAIRERYAASVADPLNNFVTQEELAIEFDVTQPHISDVIRNRRRSHDRMGGTITKVEWLVKPSDNDAPLCACGCGERVKWRHGKGWNQYKRGHSQRIEGHYTVKNGTAAPGPQLCACGCGELTMGGEYKTGHRQRIEGCWNLYGDKDVS